MHGMNTIEPPAVAIEGVSHSYGARQALDNVNVSIAPSTFAVLLGLNGAGKSTLFSLLTRLYACGVDADWRAVDAPFRRAKLGLPGYPFQRQHYWLELTPRTAAVRPTPIRDRHPFLRASAAGDEPVR